MSDNPLIELLAVTNERLAKLEELTTILGQGVIALSHRLDRLETEPKYNGWGEIE